MLVNGSRFDTHFSISRQQNIYAQFTVSGLSGLTFAGTLVASANYTGIEHAQTLSQLLREMTARAMKQKTHIKSATRTPVEVSTCFFKAKNTGHGLINDHFFTKKKHIAF